MSTETRRQELLVILTGVYGVSQGDMHQAVSLSELAKDTGVDGQFFIRQVKRLVEMEAVEWGNMGYVRITADGIKQAEEAIRDAHLGGDEDDEELSRHYPLLQKLEWERYCSLLVLFQQREESAAYDLDRREIEGGQAGYHRACFCLDGLGLVEIRMGHPIDLSYEGLDHVEDLLDQLEKADLRNPDREGYLAFRETVWKREKASKGKTPEPFTHRDDYRFVCKGGQEFTMPDRPAKVIRILNMAYKSGLPDVPKKRILDALGYGYSARVRDAFKPNHLDVWKALVTSRTRGTYRLNL